MVFLIILNGGILLTYPVRNPNALTEEEERMGTTGKDGQGGGVGFVSIPITGDMSLEEKLKSLDLNTITTIQPTIFKIPNDVRKGNERAYTPKLFSIGPNHHLEETEGIKLLFLKNLLDRNPDNNKVEKYESAIKSREEKARDYYHDRCKGVKSKDFVDMMVLDGCFIIEFFLKRAKREVIVPLKSQLRILPTLRHDLMLMENQIPFFILKLILDNSEYQVEGINEELQLLDLSLDYLHKGKITKQMLEPDHQQNDGEKVYHLLHLNYLCHMVEKIPEMESPPENLKDHLVDKLKWFLYLIGCGLLFLAKWFLLVFFYVLVSLLKFIKLVFQVMWQNPRLDNRRRQKVKKGKEKKPRMIPTATELNESGVIFKKKKDAKNKIDVSFQNGVVEIPVISLQDNSNSEFRNFLALEQNCPGVGNKFTSYAVFLNNLIDTTSDVALLKESKIIESKLGCDKDVSKFFNGVVAGVCFDFDKHYLVKLFEDVRVHWKMDHNRWRAKMARDYFSSPWSIISLFGALTLLTFSAVQVTYTIKKGRR